MSDDTTNLSNSARQAKDKDRSDSLDDLIGSLQETDEGAAPTKRLNAEIPEDLHQDFKSVAAREGRSMTQILVDLVEAYVAHKK